MSTTKKSLDVRQSFQVLEGVYLLGSLERGVTVYKQQVRAHNLVWALSELCNSNTIGQIQTIAVIGGGIAGLTATSCFLSVFPNASITLFEQLWDICPLQQGADSRWLHPRIYDWPAKGSRAPGASLPVLNWSEGRASDVANNAIKTFEKYCQQFDAQCNRLCMYVGLGYLKIVAQQQRIEWSGSQMRRQVNNGDSYFASIGATGAASQFDVIILANGFGIETASELYPTPSYWRNEQIGQPRLDGTRVNYLVSGFGDGALVDLFRLTIERFRQDSILYELFGNDLDATEFHFQSELALEDSHSKIHAILEHALATQPFLLSARERLSRRIRKDTHVVLHIKGTDPFCTSFRDIFNKNSSFLNKLMAFLLFKCGAFTLSLDEVTAAIRRHAVRQENVLLRHGADTMGHLKSLFVDFPSIEGRLKQIRETQRQVAHPAWELGTFPNLQPS